MSLCWGPLFFAQWCVIFPCIFRAYCAHSRPQPTAPAHLPALHISALPHTRNPLHNQQADEVVDPKPKVDASCHKSCTREFSEYEKCKERIKAKGTGVCEAWHFDYQKCIDACVRGGRALAACCCFLPLARLCASVHVTLTNPRAPPFFSQRTLARQAAPKLFSLLK
jgi:hypothetical protein